MGSGGLLALLLLLGGSLAPVTGHGGQVASVWRKLSAGRGAAPATTHEKRKRDFQGISDELRVPPSDVAGVEARNATAESGRGLQGNSPLCGIGLPASAPVGAAITCSSATLPQTCTLSCPSGYFVTGSPSYTCSAATCPGVCTAAYSAVASTVASYYTVASQGSTYVPLTQSYACGYTYTDTGYVVCDSECIETGRPRSSRFDSGPAPHRPR